MSFSKKIKKNIINLKKIKKDMVLFEKCYIFRLIFGIFDICLCIKHL